MSYKTKERRIRLNLAKEFDSPLIKEIPQIACLTQKKEEDIKYICIMQWDKNFILMVLLQ